MDKKEEENINCIGDLAEDDLPTPAMENEFSDASLDTGIKEKTLSNDSGFPADSFV